MPGFNHYFKEILSEHGIYVMEIAQKSMAYHSHEFYEFVYIKKGSVLHILDGKEYMVKQGDYFIIDIGSRHRYIENKDSEVILYNCLFMPKFIDKTLTHCKKFSNLIENYLIKFNQSILKFNPTTHLFHDDDASILALIEKLKMEFERKTYGFTELMRCTLIEILITTMRKIINEEKNVTYNTTTDYIINFIHQNYTKKISLSGISLQLNYSLPYLSSRFKKDTGFTFLEYLQKYRIEQSCRLLLNTNKKITEIASLVGYDDFKFFGKLFKKYMHTSPSDFRKKQT